MSCYYMFMCILISFLSYENTECYIHPEWLWDYDMIAWDQKKSTIQKLKIHKWLAIYIVI